MKITGTATYAQRRANLLGYVRNFRASPDARWWRPEHRISNIRECQKMLAALRLARASGELT